MFIQIAPKARVYVTEEDLKFINAIYQEFNLEENFLFEDILKLLKEKPNIKKIIP